MNGRERWLEVQAEPGTCLYTIGSCLTLADLQSDGDYKLVLADLGGPQSILKVLKGVSVVGQTTLPELPSGLVAVYNETRPPRIPILAVSSGPAIYFYRNMKPYFKFSLPSLEINALEMELWLQARNGLMDAKRLHEMLSALQQDLGFGRLTQQTQDVLNADLSDLEGLQEMVAQMALNPLTRRTVITCMVALRKNSTDSDAISCLVVGSEDGSITFVDAEAFTVLEQIQQCEEHGPKTIPVLIQTLGLLDVEFRVLVCNRDGRISLLRRGWKQSKVLVQVSVQPVDMLLLDSGQFVIATPSQLSYYSRKGRRQWEQPLQKPGIGLAKVVLSHLGLTLVAVAQKGGDVSLYDGRQLVDVITTTESVTAMVFGRFGQEDHCFILVTAAGNVVIKLLKRTAQFMAMDDQTVNPLVQKLSLPKRTKLIVEQVAKERENFIDIHQGFQRGLFRMRLLAARNLSETIQKSSNVISADDKIPVKMTVQVFGLGPTFKILLTLDSMASTLDHSLPPLRIVMHYNHSLYKVTPPCLQVPYLVPGLVYQMEAMVMAIGEVLVAEEILVILFTETSSKPLLSTAVHIPVCDLLPIEI